MDIYGKKVLVIGAAVTGIPTVKQLYKMGADVTLNDFKNSEALSDVLSEIKDLSVKVVAGGHPVELAEECDFIVISPGVPLNIPIVQRAKELNKEVMSEIELAYQLCHTPIAAITGTNGKTTTTALVGEIMKASGRKTFITGNIGHAMIEEIDNAGADDIFVLEASSFQLESTNHFRPTVSAVLNITPDHLDRHKTFENYIDAKCKVFNNQRSDDYVLLNKDDAEAAKLAGRAKCKLLFFSRKELLTEGAWLENDHIVVKIDDKKDVIIHKDDIYIPGSHNLEDALAAALMAYCLGVEAEVIAQTLKEFRGVEHRVEFVEEINDVLYYNDSKGTNTDASIKAIEAMKRPIILLAGGYDKGSDFSEFIQAFEDKVKALVLMGKTADKIEKTAYELGFDNIYRVDTLEKAVQKCYELAEPGDCVLLSPACASWDMFENYEERGRMFKELVRGLRGA